MTTPSALRVPIRSVITLVTASALLLVGLQLVAPSSGATTPRVDQRTRSTTASGDVSRSASTDLLARATRKSWNNHVTCRATVATLRQVLGKKKNKNGGATYRGGQFKPGIPDRRSFNPPCKQNGVPTFVQLNRVKVGDCHKINADGDWTCTLVDPSVPKRRTVKMSSIHVETDKKFRKRTNWTRPRGGILIDVQGFVFWDPGHTKESWHFFSGWEIHSLTAWRRSPKR